MSHAARAIAMQALESPAGCSQMVPRGLECPLESPESVIGGTPAPSERPGVIQQGY